MSLTPSPPLPPMRPPQIVPMAASDKTSTLLVGPAAATKTTTLPTAGRFLGPRSRSCNQHISSRTGPRFVLLGRNLQHLYRTVAHYVYHMKKVVRTTVGRGRDGTVLGVATRTPVVIRTLLKFLRDGRSSLPARLKTHKLAPVVPPKTDVTYLRVLGDRWCRRGLRTGILITRMRHTPTTHQQAPKRKTSIRRRGRQGTQPITTTTDGAVSPAAPRDRHVRRLPTDHKHPPAATTPCLPQRNEARPRLEVAPVHPSPPPVSSGNASGRPPSIPSPDGRTTTML